MSVRLVAACLWAVASAYPPAVAAVYEYPSVWPHWARPCWLVSPKLFLRNVSTVVALLAIGKFSGMRLLRSARHRKKMAHQTIRCALRLTNSTLGSSMVCFVSMTVAHYLFVSVVKLWILGRIPIMLTLVSAMLSHPALPGPRPIVMSLILLQDSLRI